MSRQRSAQLPPVCNLSGFPSTHLNTDLYRVAGRQPGGGPLGPWWFGSSGRGRFDLGPPRGTCYLGLDYLVGLLECIGGSETLTVNGLVIEEDVLRSLVLWSVRYPSPLSAADLVDVRARGLGVTNELCSMTPYTIPQQWAEALADAGHQGILYRTRFDVRPAAGGVAIFGQAGAHNFHACHQFDGHDPAVIAMLNMLGITVGKTGPTLSELVQY